MKHPTRAEQERLREAVARAERDSDLEVVLALSPESSTYQAEELRAALLGTALLQVALLLLEPWWHPLLEHLFWTGLPFSPLWVTGIFPFLCLGVLAWLFNRPRIDRFLVSPARRRAAVEQAAAALVLRHNLMGLKTRTALLLYYSLNEREIVCWADQGVLQAVGQEHWTQFCHQAREEMRRATSPTEGLVTLTEQLGQNWAPLLANPDRVNQLADGVREERP